MFRVVGLLNCHRGGWCSALPLSGYHARMRLAKRFAQSVLDVHFGSADPLRITTLMQPHLPVEPQMKVPVEPVEELRTDDHAEQQLEEPAPPK